MPSGDAPGLRKRTRSNGETAWYWVASAVVRDLEDWPLKTVRLHGDEEAMRHRCRILTAELRQWLSGRAQATLPPYDGTIAGLIGIYERDPDSPYRDVRANTRRSYDFDLRLLRAAVGGKRIAGLTRSDFTRWHREFARPREDGGEPRTRRAHGVMTMLRILMGYGASMRFAGCRDAKDILSEMRFATPERRKVAMTYDQAVAVVDKALEMGLRSIALGQALQFELGLRQIDVIGQWTAERAEGGIAYRGKVWGGGLTWADLAAAQLVKRTSKTGAEGRWTPDAYPLLVRVIAAFRDEERIGPVVVDEATGQPFKAKRYGKAWRKVARASGVPDDVWNMDSRSGALTEALAAGAAPEDVRQFATHASFSTTTRYLRDSGASTDRVAELRRRLRDGSGNGS